MPQIVECRKCSKRFQAPDQLAGKSLPCPVCKTIITIPPLKAAAAGNSAAAQPASPPPMGVAQCPHCTKKFKAPVKLQGKTVPCPSCKAAFNIRFAAATAPPAPKAIPIAGQLLPKTAVAALPKSLQPPKKSPAPAPAGTTVRRAARPRLLYLAFAIAFVPLVLQTLGGEGDAAQRFAHTLSSQPGLEEKLDELDSKSDLFALFPDGRIEGAHLSYFSRPLGLRGSRGCSLLRRHMVSLRARQSNLAQWLIVLAVTSSVGIVSLLAFQWIADATQDVWVSGRSILVLLFYIVKFIGFSYSVADNEAYGFWASFFGFTFGVGLCEEITKALPVLVYLQSDKKLDWRAACLLGLASGVGFGVVEGILYAGQHYNGVGGVDIYLTRFVSCVALHATWTAAVALMAVRNVDRFETGEALDWFLNMLMIIAVPAILHGLYDTLLKRDMGGLALVIAVASFAWLAFLIERARSGDEEHAPRGAIRVTA